MLQFRHPKEWLDRLIGSKPTIKTQPRCTCGRFCSSHEEKPDATDRLIKDMTAAGLYVPSRFANRLQDGAQ
ncbi:hypothetical protein [Devosia sp.]|uniref:hypothetical protein n=1 Tax=Devosia sp. TaxID=1871048 RepID=UPI001ACD57CD|nr:hypothetical protein [Devosia sp.]MBN9332966.1 hypothetical protein [Devosia sp.]